MAIKLETLPKRYAVTDSKTILIITLKGLLVSWKELQSQATEQWELDVIKANVQELEQLLSKLEAK